MSEKKIVRVYHSGYGCETGCCGHVVVVGDDEEFTFEHPEDDDYEAFARECGWGGAGLRAASSSGSGGNVRS